MGMPADVDVTKKLQAIPGSAPLFNAAFPGSLTGKIDLAYIKKPARPK